MPVPLATIQKASRPLSERILEVLRKAPDQAYTPTEIYGAIEGLDATGLAMFTLLLVASKGGGHVPRQVADMEVTLAELVHGGQIQRVDYQGHAYYAIKLR